MKDLKQALEVASHHFALKELDAAINACDAILKVLPGQPEASHIRAFVLLSKSQEISGKAIGQLQSSLQLNPENPLVLSTLGEAYLVANRFAESRVVLQKALSIAPEFYYGLMVMGRLLLQLERCAEAEVVLRKALSLPDTNHQATYIALAMSVMPGPWYMERLADFHEWLQPATYLEIGVETGKTLKLAQPSTVAVGIDPEPQINYPLADTTQVFSLGSDPFFEQHHLPDVLGHASLDFAFIDGLHVFDQALRDFMNIERFSRPNTVVVIHDCLPLDTASSDPKRTTKFWSGDPWKVIAALRHFRPDLTCFTIPTHPTGLGVVTNLDPANTVLKERYREVIVAYQDKNYDWLVENDLSEVLGVFVNDWDEIVARIGEAHAKHYE